MSPTSDTEALSKRLSSLRYRIEALSGLRRLVALPLEADLAPGQWAVLEGQLGATQTRLLTTLKGIERRLLPRAGEPVAERELNDGCGALEMGLARAFVLFDTYMDVLTQRLSSELGQLLRGCDALAADALRWDHPALAVVEAPLVFCDRGFGASILREGIPLPDRSSNPLPLIQIPYSRLREKYNLTSILHEVGHEAAVRLGLRDVVPRAVTVALQRRGAPALVTELFASWMAELVPDLWTFGCSGVAHAGGIQEILRLSTRDVFRIVPMDPHPPPYLRVLAAFEWCRSTWGHGRWDRWEASWRRLYPLRSAPEESRGLIESAERWIPQVAKVLLRTRFRALRERCFAELFDFSALHPERLAERKAVVRPCQQLARFRYLREERGLSEDELDSRMTEWLTTLGKRRTGHGGKHALDSR